MECPLTHHLQLLLHLRFKLSIARSSTFTPVAVDRGLQLGWCAQVLLLAFVWIQILHVSGRDLMRGWELSKDIPNKLAEILFFRELFELFIHWIFLRNFNISNYPDDKYGAEDDKLSFVISSCDAWSSSRFVHRHTSSREILKEFLCSNVCSWIHFWCLNNQLIDENWKLVLDSMSVGGSWMSIAMMEQDV